MVTSLEISFTGWNPDGKSLSQRTLLEELGVETNGFPCVGEGKPWQSVRVVLISRTLEQYLTKAEPSESFFRDLECDFRQAAEWLSRISVNKIEQCRARSREMNIVVDAEITQD